MVRAKIRASGSSRSSGSVVALRTTSKVARWGNSLGLRIPTEGVRQLRLAEGQVVSVEVQADCITIRSVRQRRRWTLDALLKGVTPEMVGDEVDWGAPVGKEIW